MGVERDETGLRGVKGEYSTRLIVALDPPPTVKPADWASRIIERLSSLVAGFKVGWPLVVSTGINEVRNLFCRAAGLRVLDLKLADVFHVMRLVLEPFVDCFDAVIAHAFIGVEGALSELREYLEENGARLVLVYSMSHPGAAHTFDVCSSVIDSVVEKVKPWGLVAPATRPEVIKKARLRYSDIVIMSPGVGAQGAEPGTAICAGADYEIVGRSVAWSDDPIAALNVLEKRAQKTLSRCTSA